MLQRKRHLIILFISLSLTLALVTTGAVQSGHQVRLFVNVFDAAGQQVEDLKKENFSVLEDNVPQQLTSFSHERSLVSLSLVIDTSGSMKTKMRVATSTLTGLLGQLQAEDEALLSQFKTEAELIEEYTTDRRRLIAALSGLYTSGGSAVFDAVLANADYARERAKHPQKALVVITDGLEKNSSTSENDLFGALAETGVRVFFIVLLDEKGDKDLTFQKPKDFLRVKEKLSRIAAVAGGQAFFPQTVSDLTVAIERIESCLRTPYVLTYSSANNIPDGKLRRMDVVVQTSDQRQLQALAPQNWTLPKPAKGKQKKDKKKQ